MGQPNVDRLDSPLPAYRGLETVAVAVADITFTPSRIVRVLTAGNLSYEDSLGERHDLTGLTANTDITGPGGGLVLVRKIFGTSTVTSVQTGIF